MVSVQCYMSVCRLVISVQGVIIIDLSSLGCIVPEILKSIKKIKNKDFLLKCNYRTLRILSYISKYMIILIVSFQHRWFQEGLYYTTLPIIVGKSKKGSRTKYIHRYNVNRTI